MEGTITQDSGIVGAILLFGLMFLGFRIMLGRAAVPVLIVAAIFTVANMFPNDPVARLISSLTMQFVVPVFVLWLLWHSFLKPMVEPGNKRNDQ